MTQWQAVWNDTVIAESDRIRRVEGNVYFPPESVRREFLRESTRTSLCPWKGKARYYDLAVAGAVNPAAAWYYPRPSVLARRIRDHVAFWNGVEVRAVDFYYAFPAPRPGRWGWVGWARRSGGRSTAPSPGAPASPPARRC